MSLKQRVAENRDCVPQLQFRNAQYVCWTRMQAEAGQPLEDIVARKERERRAGSGLFMWGVGNAPSTAISSLARLRVKIPVIFSAMKSKPKAVDLAPNRTVAWRRYIDEYGVERSLPDGALVTSRGDSSGGAKSRHFALMCYSDCPIVLARGAAFDHTAFRNVSAAGAPVGASQVTALVRQVSDQKEYSGYEANMVAFLTGGYWVRLTDPVEISKDMIDRVARFDGGVGEWQALTDTIRTGAEENSRASQRQGILL